MIHELTSICDIGIAIEHAAEVLPFGWEVSIDVERGAASVYVYAPDGSRTDIPQNGEYLSEQIERGIQYAIDQQAATS